MASPSTSQIADRTPVPFGAWVGVVLLFLVFGLVVLVLIGVSPRGDSYEARRAKERLDVLKKLQDEANAELHSYAWVDKNKGVARIPIDRAMELTVAELAQKSPAPANPVEAPSPVAGSPAAAPQQSPSTAGSTPQATATQTGAVVPSATPTATARATGIPKAKAVQGVDSENRNQSAAAANPPGAAPGTQPGAFASPAATSSPQTAQPPVSPSATPVPPSAGTPIPVAGKTPPP